MHVMPVKICHPQGLVLFKMDRNIVFLYLAMHKTNTDWYSCTLCGIAILAVILYFHRPVAKTLSGAHRTLQFRGIRVENHCLKQTGQNNNRVYLFMKMIIQDSYIRIRLRAEQKILGSDVREDQCQTWKYKWIVLFCSIKTQRHAH